MGDDGVIRRYRVETWIGYPNKDVCVMAKNDSQAKYLAWKKLKENGMVGGSFKDFFTYACPVVQRMGTMENETV